MRKAKKSGKKITERHKQEAGKNTTGKKKIRVGIGM